MRLVVATRNPGKRREFAVLLHDLVPPGTEFTDVTSWPTPVPEVIEDGDTFEANAIKKAYEVSMNTGATTLADDSGLEVDALGGRPGVFSARWAGPECDDDANNALLVRELADVPHERRTARYVAVLALCVADDALGRALQLGEPTGTGAEEGVPFRLGDRTLVWVRATCEGRILDEARGDGGFGYDPYFFVDDWGQTMAEVPLARKNERSHRAAATRKLSRAVADR